MKKLLTLLIAVIALIGCQKAPDWNKLSNELMVYTHHDKDFDFAQCRTVYIPDSILLLDNTQEEGIYIASEDDMRARTILEVLREELTKCGYTETNDRTQADLGVITTFIKRTNTYVGYDYPYWWYDFYYWPFDYWDPYYYDWYPYYPYPVTYTYTTSSLAVEMIALQQKNATDKLLPFVWTACLAGVDSNNQLNTAYATTGLYQAFEQSPYIKAQ